MPLQNKTEMTACVLVVGALCCILSTKTPTTMYFVDTEHHTRVFFFPAPNDLLVTSKTIHLPFSQHFLFCIHSWNVYKAVRGFAGFLASYIPALTKALQLKEKLKKMFLLLCNYLQQFFSFLSQTTLNILHTTQRFSNRSSSHPLQHSPMQEILPADSYNHL